MGLPSALQPMLDPLTYPHPVRAVQLVETPISWVLLTGSHAYKIKRPVRLDFIDLRAAVRRAELCHEELRLNRRFAPELYLGVATIRRVGEGLRIDAGSGEVIEHAVCMRQFERREELNQLLADGRIEPSELAQFGQQLAALHALLAPVSPAESWGTPGQVRTLVLENLEQCRRAALSPAGAQALAVLQEPLDALLDAAAARIAARREAGFVRECHGDLHTRNIVRHAGRLVAFDCIEFEPAFRWIDTADDVAFLIADLEVHAAPRHAWAFRQGYLDVSGDFGVCSLQPLCQTHRALVRAKVTALSARDADAGDREELRRSHDAYVRHATAMLRPQRPRIVLLSGLSGSGKTWLAERLAPEFGAVHLRSDVERKRLGGLGPMDQSRSAPGEGLYTPGASAALYHHLLHCTRNIIEGACSVIVDATFLDQDQLQPWFDLAEASGASLHRIRCHAPQALLERRIEERGARGGDASEADLAVLHWQLARSDAQSTGRDAGTIEADTSRADVVQRVCAALRADSGQQH